MGKNHNNLPIFNKLFHKNMKYYNILNISKIQIFSNDVHTETMLETILETMQLVHEQHANLVSSQGTTVYWYPGVHKINIRLLGYDRLLILAALYRKGRFMFGCLYVDPVNWNYTLVYYATRARRLLRGLPTFALKIMLAVPSM